MGVGIYGIDAWDEKAEEFKEGVPYFGRNWFGWRPLWNFVYENCKDLITEDQWNMGHANCGDLFDQETCRKIAERLKGLKVKDSPEPEIKTITPEMSQEKADQVMKSWYGFGQEDLDEFVEFLSKTNGMAIY